MPKPRPEPSRFCQRDFPAISTRALFQEDSFLCFSSFGKHLLRKSFCCLVSAATSSRAFSTAVLRSGVKRRPNYYFQWTVVLELDEERHVTGLFKLRLYIAVFVQSFPSTRQFLHRNTPCDYQGRKTCQLRRRECLKPLAGAKSDSVAAVFSPFTPATGSRIEILICSVLATSTAALDY